MKLKIYFATLLPVFVLLFSMNVHADSFVDFEISNSQYTIYGYDQNHVLTYFVPETNLSPLFFVKYSHDPSWGYTRFDATITVSGSSLSGGRIAIPYSFADTGDYNWYRLIFKLYNSSGVNVQDVSYYIPEGNNVVYIDIPSDVYVLEMTFDLSYSSLSSLEFIYSKPYFVADGSVNDTTVLEHIEQQTQLQTDIKAEIAQQTSQQQSVIDNADTAFEGVNDSLDESISDYQDSEASLLGAVDTTIGNFDFSDHLISNVVGGFMPAMTFLSAQMETLFNLTEFSSVFYVVYALAIAAILLGVVGLWRK